MTPEERERRERLRAATRARQALCRVGICDACGNDVRLDETGTFRHKDSDSDVAAAFDADHPPVPVCDWHTASSPVLDPETGRCPLCEKEDAELERAGL